MSLKYAHFILIMIWIRLDITLYAVLRSRVFIVESSVHKPYTTRRYISHIVVRKRFWSCRASISHNQTSGMIPRTKRQGLEVVYISYSLEDYNKKFGDNH